MRLKELLLDGFNGVGVNTENKNTLKSDELKLYRNSLLECEELKGIEIEFMSHPTIEIDNKTYPSETMIIGPVYQFERYKKIYLHSFILTGEIYDPSIITNPVKDGACIGPRQYNVTNFEPSVKVVLSYDPETCSIETEEGKNKLRELLEKVLTSPHEYTHKPEKGLMIRGVFIKKN